MPHTPARVRFQRLTGSALAGEEWGEISLDVDGVVRLSASASLRGRLSRTADRVDKAALMYGAGGFMTVAAFGTALILKRRTLLGFLLLVFAAVIALGGSRVRTAARSTPRGFDTVWDASAVFAEISPEGAFTVRFTPKQGEAVRMRFEAGEFDRSQATAFAAALGSVPARSPE